MIQLATVDGRTLAMIMCDACEVQIDDAGMGMVRWSRADDSSGNVIEKLTFCHKGKCDEELNAERPDDPWWELSHFLARLLTSTGMDVAAVEGSMADVGGLSKLP